MNLRGGQAGERATDPSPRRRHAPVDVPTVLLVAAWLTIWLLFPLNGHDKQRSRMPTTGRVGYLAGGPAAPWYLEPDWFARTTRPGFGMPDVTAAMDSAVPERSALGTPRFVGGGLDIDAPASGEMPETATNAGMRVRWAAKPAFAPVFSAPPVVVTMSQGLTTCGFALPPFTNDVKTVPAGPWQVVAHVDVDAEGRVENALIELGCEDPRVNATIARWLCRGVASAPGTAVSGRVMISGAGSR